MHSLLSGDLGNQGHISSSSCSHYVVMVTPQARRLGSSPVSKNTEDIVRDPHPTHSTLSRFHGNTCPIISMGIFINKRRGDCDPDCQSDDNSTSKRSHPVGLFFCLVMLCPRRPGQSALKSPRMRGVPTSWCQSNLTGPIRNLP